MSSVGLSIESNASLSFSISENKLPISGSSLLKRKEKKTRYVQQQGSATISHETNHKDEKDTKYAKCST
jgi:hypothetical protein